MKTNFKIVFLTALGLLAGVGYVSAQEFVYNGINYQVVSVAEKVARVAKNPVASGEIVIPSSVIFDNNGSPVDLRVIAIGESAFESNSLIKSVKIPDTVEVIENYAFDECDNLASVDFGSSITSIGDCAFRNCSSLAEIDLSPSVESVGKFGFGYCGNLKRAYIGESLKVISYAMFANNFELEHVNIPETVTEIGVSAFSDCWSLQELNLPEGLKSIRVSAIYRCKSLKEIIIPSTVTGIGMSNFWKCDNLRKVMSLTPQPLAIDEGNFSQSPNEILVVPEGLKDAYMEMEGWNKFGEILEIMSPESLIDGVAYTRPDNETVTVAYISSTIGENVTIPANIEIGGVNYDVAGIGLNAAVMNDDITSLSISAEGNDDAAYVIGENSFANCTGISHVSCGYIVPPVASDNSFATEVYENATITVPDSDAYRNAAACWGRFKNYAVTGAVNELVTDIDEWGDEIYTLSGLKVNKDNLSPGIYIRKTSNGFVKVIVR